MGSTSGSNSGFGKLSVFACKDDRGPNGQAIHMVKGMRLPSKPTVAESGRIGSSRTRYPGTIRTLFLLAILYAFPANAQQSLIVERIVVEGNAAIAEDRILGLIETRTDSFLRPRFWKRSRVNNAIWRTDLTAIESFYRNSGFLDARVRSVREEIDTDRVALRIVIDEGPRYTCLLYTSPSPRDGLLSRMPSSA